MFGVGVGGSYSIGDDRVPLEAMTPHSVSSDSRAWLSDGRLQRTKELELETAARSWGGHSG